jgi:hypothetical protein
LLLLLLLLLQLLLCVFHELFVLCVFKHWGHRDNNGIIVWRVCATDTPNHAVAAQNGERYGANVGGHAPTAARWPRRLGPDMLWRVA